MSHPLVSICLKAYNQKDFIGEALEGVLAQTYRPLEIVISDDCSSDGTWELLKEKVGSRECEVGSEQRKIILHRNEVNLGNAKNWEMCGKLAHGELLVKADGDDVSEPERVEKIVEAWVKGGKQAKAISSGCRVMDVNGRILGERRDVKMDAVLGAVQTWSRDCLVGWPELPSTKAMDDVICCERAKLLGGAEIVLPDLLVRYRKGCGISTRGSYRNALSRIFQTEKFAQPVCRADVAWYKAQGGDAANVARVLSDLDERDAIADNWLRLLDGGMLWTRLRGLGGLWHRHNYRGKILLVLFALPFHLGDPIIAKLRRSC